MQMTHLVEDCAAFIGRTQLHDLVAQTDMTAFLTLLLSLPQGQPW